MDKYRYVLKQRCKDGVFWTSEVSFEGTFREVQMSVIAGYLAKEPRWAETETGMFIFGIDALGKDHRTGTSSPDFG